MTFVHNEGTFTRRATLGPALYFNAAVPEGPPKAAVGLLHGYADYGARYAHVLASWAARGIVAVAVDMRGHGRAEGRRGYCDRFSQYLDDAAELEQLVVERAAGAPVFLFGHSFGALVAALRAIDHPSPWRGLMLSAPYLGLALQVPRAKIFAGEVASRIVPTLALPTGLQGAQLTHDGVRARAYDDDPRVFKAATARWFTETREAQARALAQARSLALPLYLVMGGSDPVARVDTARAFFDGVSVADKTWDLRDGLLHEVLNEPEWPSIADKLAEFMLSHAAALPSR